MLAGFGKAIYVSIVILIARAASMKKITSDTKKGRGRPALLERTAGAAVAETLFHREGYDQLGIAALCDALGVRQPALYRVFGSKAGLFEAALEQYGSSRFASFVAEEIARAKTADALKRNVLLRAAETYTAAPERRGCLALETAYGSADPSARAAANTLVENVRKMLTERFSSLGAQEPAANADGVILIMRGLSSEARSGRTANALRNAVEALTG
ncbi:MAG: TetR/AcrR family transcriptional regulator [Pseudomonadota bacterium]